MKQSEIKALLATHEIAENKTLITDIINLHHDKLSLAKTQAENNVDERIKTESEKQAKVLAKSQLDDLLKEKTAELEKAWQAKVDEADEKTKNVQAELEETKSSYANKQKADKTRTKVLELLQTKDEEGRSLSADDAQLALRGFDIGTVEIDADGNIKSAEDVLKVFKEDPILKTRFATVVTEPNPPATPPQKKELTGSASDYQNKIAEARKTGNTQEAVRLKYEASKQGVIIP